MKEYEGALEGKKGIAESRLRKNNGEYILIRTYYYPDFDKEGNFS